MPPTHQCLQPDDAQGRDVDQRLIAHGELVALQGRTQLLLEHAAASLWIIQICLEVEDGRHDDCRLWRCGPAARHAPLFSETLRELLYLDVVEWFLQNDQSIRMRQTCTNLLPRVIRVCRTQNNLDGRVDFPQLLDCFKTIPTRWHPGIHEGKLEGRAALPRATRELYAFPTLRGAADGVLRSRAGFGRRAEQRAFGFRQGRGAG